MTSVDASEASEVNGCGDEVPRLCFFDDIERAEASASFVDSRLSMLVAWVWISISVDILMVLMRSAEAVGLVAEAASPSIEVANCKELPGADVCKGSMFSSVVISRESV
jgi:hypothetical protein